MSLEESKNPNGGNRQGFEVVNENPTKGNATMTSLALKDNFVKTMSSKQIADVVGSRHDSVKRTIERLAEKGIISFTPMVETSHEGAGARPVEVYQVNERDSYVVVAQLCPEFTAKLVDYWQATKNQQPVVALPTTYLDALKALVQTEEEKQLAIAQVAQLETKVDELQPKANALDSLANATGLKTIQQTAKVLGVQPEKFLRPWMLENGWLHTAADGQYHAYAERIRAGHLKEKDRLITHKSGTQEIRVTVYVTPKGEALLAQRISNNPKAA